MKAKKSLGQHFLKSERALRQIVSAAKPTPEDCILEIGPGHGVLTERLIPLVKKVFAVEKDRELIPLLTKKFRDEVRDGTIEIIEQDILKWSPEALADTSYKLVANIPYYITGAIIEQFLSAAHQPTIMVLLMQREVAERIVARDGKESILSIAVHVYGIPQIIDRVPPGAFAPAPTVESAILSIEHITRDFFADCNESLFFAVLKSVFGKKRKQIGGSLSEYLDNREEAHRILDMVSIDPKSRPEDIHIYEWKKLVQAIHTK